MLIHTSAIIFVLQSISLVVNASEWASPAEEALDERHDVEIFQAVVSSMAKWRNRHNNHYRQKRAESNVCYGDLGCFEATGPFSYLELTPSPPDDIGTRFLMYPGRRAGRSTNLLDVPFENMTTAWKWADKGGFNQSLPTKIIVHGFGSSCTNVWVYEMRSALMAVEECNIICVDWEAGAVIPNYVRAAANTRLVGAQLARLLRGLSEHAGLPTQNMHLIGFSLGAHVAGFAGSELGGNLSRITGLDPAGPLFESQDPRVRLDSTDANFVDVIHSNGENLILGGLGSWQPMGHVDFYPNGGRMQKGCSNLFVGAVSDIIWSSAVEGRSLCNHRRAYKFFTDSVSPRCHFPAFPCDSYDNFLQGNCFPCASDRRCGNMGYYADRSTGRGQLYLITRDEEPFCAHQYQVKIDSSPSETLVVSYGKILITLVGEGELNETFTMTHKDDEELVLGGSLSKILVPHPVLGEPVKVQILYVAYSGWLSSGLARWKIDKVSFSDSFGKSSSVCQKGLDLESGVPVILPLYPGDCNPPTTNFSETNENSTLKSNTTKNTNGTFNEFGFFKPIAHPGKFIPTPVVKIGNEAIEKTINTDIHLSVDRSDVVLEGSSPENIHPVLNVNWKPINEYSEGNTVEDSTDETESGRALNTRATIVTNQNNSYTDRPNISTEIVEPILKPTATNKIARSHNDRDLGKPEITEPLLSATTSRTAASSTSVTNNIKRDTRVPAAGDNAPALNIFSSDSDNDWIPTVALKTPSRPAWSSNRIKDSSDGSDTLEKSPNNVSNTFQRFLSNRNLRNIRDRQDTVDNSVKLPFEDPNESKRGNIVSITVQLLPQRLASMLEQAERYARMTLLPLISAHTPKIFTDFVSTFTDNNPKYLPLSFEEFRQPDENTTTKSSDRLQNIKSLNISPPNLLDDINNTSKRDLSTAMPLIQNLTDLTTIKNEAANNSIFLVYPQNTNITSQLILNNGEIISSSPLNISTPTKNSTFSNKLNIGEVLMSEITTLAATGNENVNMKNKLYVNLPVYDNNNTEPSDNKLDSRAKKYIPLNFDETTKANTES